MSETGLVGSGRSAIVWVSGPDTVAFLDGLLSQNIAAIPVGASARSLLLAPNGKLRSTLFVLRGAERVGLVCDAGRVDVIVADLARFKIRVDVVVAVEPQTIWEVWGGSSAEMPPLGTWVDDPRVRFQMPFRHVATSRVLQVGGTAPGPVASDGELEAFRVLAGEPVMGVDLDESTIPQEGAEVAISVDFTKGCYLGQELVARIEARGHVNRRLAGLAAYSGRLSAGAEIRLGDRLVGMATSTASRGSRSIALAMIRAEVEPGSKVDVAGVAAEVLTLPMSL